MSKGSNSRKKARASQKSSAASSSASGARRAAVGPHGAQSAQASRIQPGPEVTQVTQVLDIAPVAHEHEHEHGADEEAFFQRGHQEFVLSSESFGSAHVDDGHELEEAPSRHALPSAVARRARLRRVFTAVMGFASVLTVVVTARALAQRVQAPAASMADTALLVPQPVVPSIDLSAPGAETLAEVNIMAERTAPTPAEATAAPIPALAAAPAIAAPVAKPVQPANEPAKAALAAPLAARVAKPSVSTPSPSAPVHRATKSEARKLIFGGRMQDGIVTARSALQSDIGDAELYLLLGAALQDTGRWGESRAVFANCAKYATRGPVDECRSLKGR
jgi:colicin import membrane protein